MPSTPAQRTPARERKRVAKAADAARLEKAAELLAPAVQRHGVLVDGEVYAHPRVERDGISFRVSNPILHMANHGGATRDHVRAANRLRAAWELGGRDVGMASRWYGERASATVESGVISEHILAALGQQNRAREECLTVIQCLRGQFNVVKAVVLDGIDVAAWGRKTGKNPQVAKGYVLSGLDELVTVYEKMDRTRERTSRMRAAVVVRRSNGVGA